MMALFGGSTVGRPSDEANSGTYLRSRCGGCRPAKICKHEGVPGSELPKNSSTIIEQISDAMRLRILGTIAVLLTVGCSASIFLKHRTDKAVGLVELRSG